jgi:hypothetical protein
MLLNTINKEFMKQLILFAVMMISLSVIAQEPKHLKKKTDEKVVHYICYQVEGQIKHLKEKQK